MRYEQPRIVEREPIAGLLTDFARSEPPTKNVHPKKDVVPAAGSYAAPAVVEREPINALMITAKSDRRLN